MVLPQVVPEDIKGPIRARVQGDVFAIQHEEFPFTIENGSSVAPRTGAVGFKVHRLLVVLGVPVLILDP